MLIALLASCNSNKTESDAYGNFEATETIISAESGGKLVFIDAEEGARIEMGTCVAIIDTTDLVLKMEQLEAHKRAIQARSENVFSQIDVYNQQKENLKKDSFRLDNLVKEGAATQKQLDDVIGAINLVNKQIKATETQNISVINEMAVVEKQIDQIEESIHKSYITMPFTATVLEKYIEKFELVTPGKPLFKMASLDSLYLRAFVSGQQLAGISIGQRVSVKVDTEGKEMKTMEGVITWIAADAEFTPKIIQTREERVNLVYAVKIKTANDGTLKMGMPAEVVFSK